MTHDLRPLLLPLLLAAVGGCAQFDGPPEPSIRGLVDGLLTDAKAPLVIDFTEAIREDSLTLEVGPYVVDAEGNLADEDSDPATDLDSTLFYSFIGGYGDIPGNAHHTFGDGDTSFTIRPATTLPIGPRLVVLVEPGLSDTGGVTTVARRRLVFGYNAEVKCNAPTTFRSGYSFYLAAVKVPVPTQVQLYASLDVDADTGAFVGQFTNADRDRTPGRCGALQCPDDICRLLPSPACAAPSDPAGTVDEFSDYLPNNAPPAGYSFTAHGCVVDQPDGTVTFVTSPVDVNVAQPAVTLRNARLQGSFKKSKGVYYATGSFSADDVLLSGTSSGGTAGDLTARTLTRAEAPPGIPDPPKE